jgi:hypothetical protein
MAIERFGDVSLARTQIEKPNNLVEKCIPKDA